MASRLLKSTRTTLLSVPTKTLTRFASPPPPPPPPHHIFHAPTTTLLSVPTKTLTRFAPPPPPPPPPHHILHAPTTTTTPPRFPILSAPHLLPTTPSRFPILSAPHLLLTNRPVSPHLLLLTSRPVPPHHLLTTRGFSSPGDNSSNSSLKMVLSKAIKRVSDWVNLQPFPPAVKAFLQTILKGMLFAAGEKAFEQIVTLFFWVMGRLKRWWKGEGREGRG